MGNTAPYWQGGGRGWLTPTFNTISSLQLNSQPMHTNCCFLISSSDFFFLSHFLPLQLQIQLRQQFIEVWLSTAVWSDERKWGKTGIFVRWDDRWICVQNGFTKSKHIRPVVFFFLHCLKNKIKQYIICRLLLCTTSHKINRSPSFLFYLNTC